MLLSLFNEGRLPWSNATSDEESLRLKRSCDIGKLAKQYDCPEIAQIIRQSRDAVKSVGPDYESIRNLLRAMQANVNYLYSNITLLKIISLL